MHFYQCYLCWIFCVEDLGNKSFFVAVHKFTQIHKVYIAMVSFPLHCEYRSHKIGYQFNFTLRAYILLIIIYCVIFICRRQLNGNIYIYVINWVYIFEQLQNYLGWECGMTPYHVAISWIMVWLHDYILPFSLWIINSLLSNPTRWSDLEQSADQKTIKMSILSKSSNLYFSFLSSHQYHCRVAWSLCWSRLISLVDRQPTISLLHFFLRVISLLHNKHKFDVANVYVH